MQAARQAPLFSFGNVRLTNEFFTVRQSSEALAAWLDQKPSSWGRALSARLALRVAPNLANLQSICFRDGDEAAVERILLGALRTLFAAWAQSAYPQLSDENQRRRMCEIISALLAASEAAEKSFLDPYPALNDYHISAICEQQHGAYRTMRLILNALEPRPFVSFRFHPAERPGLDDPFNTVVPFGPESYENVARWRVMLCESIADDMEYLVRGSEEQPERQLMFEPLWRRRKDEALALSFQWRDSSNLCRKFPDFIYWLEERASGCLVLAKEPEDSSARIAKIVALPDAFWEQPLDKLKSDIWQAFMHSADSPFWSSTWQTNAL
ncbi:MAG: hypothetical protein CTY15_05300 [Methylocystis sp.]|nr:MAG: hypothetical protein CTY15_05300 [Methylocystis sp.]